jgi:1,4-dihydroxy-2-naphthoate octaprenyltransferase
VRPGSARAWLLASRPATLTAAFVPVAVGTACAAAIGGLRWDTAIAAMLGAFGIQIGTNFANDVFDAEKGADTEARLGPTRAVQAGLLGARQMRVGMAAAFGFATLCGIYLAAVAGWPVVAIGIASILSGIAYTGGPYPLGYHGLGDVFVFVFFGLVAVCGTVLVQAGWVPEIALWASVPVGAIATAILVVNNLRDRHTDVGAGKRTLAVRFGRTGAEVEYGLCVLAAYAVPVAMWLRGLSGTAVLLPLLTLPWALRLFGEVRTREGAPLNATLAATAKLLLVHGVLFALGLALGG